MRILFLNQYFPPDPAPTGILLAEIATALRQRGHEVVEVQAAEAYRDNGGRRMRLARELIALLTILWRGTFCRRAQVVVSGSSPPCLSAVAALVSLRHRASHLHWVMDLYPEVAVALREVREGILVALIRGIMKLSYRSARAVVSVDSDMSTILRRYGIQSLECRPWVAAGVLARLPRAAPPPSEPWTWVYSGNLGRAHDWQTLLAAQATLEERGVDATLVFQGGGPAWGPAAARAEELKLQRVGWRPYAPEAELCNSLLRAHCLVVTQLPETSGLLWPSKVALLLGLPRPVVYVGPKTGSLAELLRDRPGSFAFASGDFRAVADAITRLRQETNVAVVAQVEDVAQHRSKSLAWWVDLVERAGTR